MRSRRVIFKKQRVLFPPIPLNVRLFLIFLICLTISVIAFVTIVLKYSALNTFEEQQRKEEKKEKILFQLTDQLQTKNIRSDNINAIASTIKHINNTYPAFSFLVANTQGDIIFHTSSSHIRTKNVKNMLKQKLTVYPSNNGPSTAAYSSIISPVSFQDGLGYLIIESSTPKLAISPAQYNRQLIIVFGCSVLIFILLFILFMHPITQYIKQIENGIRRIVKKDWTYSIPIKGRNELSSLATNINWMTEQLRQRFEREREVEHAKNELITNLSHDLRTPLTSIIGYLKLVKDQQYNSEQERQHYIETTYNISLKFKNLVDELFEYTKLSLADVETHFQQVDLNGLLYQLVGEYTPILENQGLRVHLTLPDEPALVSVDVEKMVRVFDNLLSNAEKYSYKSSDVKIVLQKSQDQVIVSISNKTDYIEPEELDKLFERFYRIDKARSSTVSGSGIGLAIAKRIVDLHKGKIWAESEGNKIKIYVALHLHKKVNDHY
ncbi:HAMP domain-containing histidine kinase [Priestia aryabhattai]|uniref:histidine kinase n=1 Tax=Priestia megaterium TaxID=1404 RepID=A0AAX6BHT3_PRIMG|nr:MULTISPECIES: HAMP domain-containing sensor histidine kinase [Priestia]MCA1049274.1 HAMP domain-containing histidine kinase [Priestia aryabhattai]MED3821413.1 HAMP domain-containing sensor histidine kinase [Priestia aryabhattai]NGY86190.1 HAMP domain-containing histidine kinase [Priestia megaterium]GMG73318.1 HAMP domain-containing sensor histidine kinase [Priestia megaterium]